MGSAPSAQAKNRQLARYDERIGLAERNLQKLRLRRAAVEADWNAQNCDVELPENFDALRAIEAYLQDYGVSARVFGTTFFGDPRFVYDLRKGRTPNELNTRLIFNIVRKAPSEKSACPTDYQPQ